MCSLTQHSNPVLRVVPHYMDGGIWVIQKLFYGLRLPCGHHRVEVSRQEERHLRVRHGQEAPDGRRQDAAEYSEVESKLSFKFLHRADNPAFFPVPTAVPGIFVLGISLHITQVQVGGVAGQFAQSC